jgi:hypothetical protein
MADTYLPAFEAGVKLGKASGIMCSYNDETYGYGVYGNSTLPPTTPPQVRMSDSPVLAVLL